MYVEILKKKFDTQKSLSVRHNVPIPKCPELWRAAWLTISTRLNAFQLAIGDRPGIILSPRLTLMQCVLFIRDLEAALLSLDSGHSQRNIYIASPSSCTEKQVILGARVQSTYVHVESRRSACSQPMLIFLHSGSPCWLQCVLLVQFSIIIQIINEVPWLGCKMPKQGKHHIHRANCP